MQPINYQGASVLPPTVVVPTGVRIISWIMLFFGVLIALEAIFIIITSLGSSLAFITILPLVQGSLLVSIAFGIRKMRRWALYLFTALTIFSIVVAIYNFMSETTSTITGIVDTGISLIILAYFWSIRSRWV